MRYSGEWSAPARLYVQRQLLRSRRFEPTAHAPAPSRGWRHPPIAWVVGAVGAAAVGGATHAQTLRRSGVSRITKKKSFLWCFVATHGIIYISHAIIRILFL